MNFNQNRELLTVLLIVKVVYGVKVMTMFEKLAGESDDNDLKCAAKANDRYYQATMIDASNTCTNLDWSWASNPTYEIGATYYWKKQVVEIYAQPPAQQDTMVLPITLGAGSYIDMYITPHYLLAGTILLADTLDISTTMKMYLIHMRIIPTQRRIQFKTYRQVAWTTRASITPYPFGSNTTHKVTFKALHDVIQILLDDQILEQYSHITPPENARMLVFTVNGAILLHKIDFVGV